MLDNINILKIASAMARYAAHRHQVLSNNIANADTNNFKAKDLEPFSTEYSRLADKNDRLEARLNLGDRAFPWRVSTTSAPGMESPNGNTVSLEDQMMRSIETQQDHDAAILIYSKSIELLRMSLGRGA